MPQPDLLFDADGIAFDVINFDFDGQELNAGAIDPVRNITSTGIATAYSFTGFGAAQGATGHDPVIPILGRQTPDRVVTGAVPSLTSQGRAVSYSFTGSV